MSKMEEHEFKEQLLEWSKHGKFDDIDGLVKLKASFEFCDYAGDHYIAYCIVNGRYNWCGLTIKIIPDSNVTELLLISVE